MRSHDRVALPVVVMRRSCEIREPEEARPTRKEWVPLKPVGALNRNETACPGTYDSTV
jgi:hypothetical protein